LFVARLFFAVDVLGVSSVSCLILKQPGVPGGRRFLCIELNSDTDVFSQAWFWAGTESYFKNLDCHFKHNFNPFKRTTAKDRFPFLKILIHNITDVILTNLISFAVYSANVFPPQIHAVCAGSFSICLVYFIVSHTHRRVPAGFAACLIWFAGFTQQRL
jgi:hypothetical protein